MIISILPALAYTKCQDNETLISQCSLSVRVEKADRRCEREAEEQQERQGSTAGCGGCHSWEAEAFFSSPPGGTWRHRDEGPLRIVSPTIK